MNDTRYRSMRRVQWVALALFAGLTVGCTDPSTDSGAADTTDDGEVETAADTTTGDEAESSGETTAADGASLPGERPAIGIELDTVEVNQGIGFEVASDGQVLDEDALGGRFVRRRPALVRATWILQGDWTPRTIRAELVLQARDGETTTFTAAQFVEGPSSLEQLDTAFQWTVDGAAMQPGAGYRLELFELDPEYPGGDTEVRLPSDGFAALPVGDQHQHLDVVLVPIDYDADDCDAPVVAGIDDELVPRIRDTLFGMQPVAEVSVTLREREVWTGPPLTESMATQFVQQIRAQDDPAPWVHYFGVWGNPCSGPLQGVGGSAYGQLADPPRPRDSANRVAWTPLSFQTQFNFAASAMARTLGLLLGHGNASCPGRPAQHPVDDILGGDSVPDYGYDLVNRHLILPGTRSDIQSLCTPTWTSRERWRLSFSALETMSQWKDQ